MRGVKILELGRYVYNYTRSLYDYSNYAMSAILFVSAFFIHNHNPAKFFLIIVQLLLSLTLILSYYADKNMLRNLISMSLVFLTCSLFVWSITPINAFEMLLNYHNVEFKSKLILLFSALILLDVVLMLIYAKYQRGLKDVSLFTIFYSLLSSFFLTAFGMDASLGRFTEFDVSVYPYVSLLDFTASFTSFYSIIGTLSAFFYCTCASAAYLSNEKIKPYLTKKKREKYRRFYDFIGNLVAFKKIYSKKNNDKVLLIKSTDIPI